MLTSLWIVLNSHYLKDALEIIGRIEGDVDRPAVSFPHRDFNVCLKMLSE